MRLWIPPALLDSVRSKLERNWDAKQFDQAQELAQQAITRLRLRRNCSARKLAALEEWGQKKRLPSTSGWRSALWRRRPQRSRPTSSPEHQPDPAGPFEQRAGRGRAATEYSR